MAEVSAILDHWPVCVLVLFANGFFIASWRKHEPFAPAFAVSGNSLVAVLGVPEQVLGARERLGMEDRDIAGMLWGKGSFIC